MADKHDDKKLPNLKVLRSFRIRGEAISAGSVIPKSRFNKKTDWQNLAHMTNPKVEETDRGVGNPKADKKSSALPKAS